MKLALLMSSCTFAAFTRGVDYSVDCAADGIHVTSSSSSFVLTDRAHTVDKECHESSHWNAYGGSIFLPSCLNIQEDVKVWNGIIITRKEGPRTWKSETLFVECEAPNKSDQDSL